MPRVAGQTALARRAKQPMYFLMKDQGRSIGAIADVIGVSYLHLRGAMYGTTYPSTVLRDKLPKFFGVPLSELFDADILAGEHDHRKAGRWAK